MSTEWVIWCVVMALVLTGSAVCLWLERRDDVRHAERLATDPEYAQRHHEVHKYDDWEDMGYFDGR